jgi:hypothetical protein
MLTSPRTYRSSLAFALLAALIALALAAGPASASRTRLFVEPFGSAAQPVFGGEGGLAFDQSSGELLVIDGAAQTLSRYHADGTPSNFSALGTNVITAGGSGAFSFGSGRESQVAVDESGGVADGDIYLAQGNGHKALDVFSNGGALLGQLTAAGATPFGEICGVAVDGGGNLFVGDRSGKVHRFEPAVNPPLNLEYKTSLVFSDPGQCALAAGRGPTAGYLFLVDLGGEFFGSPHGLFKVDAASGAVQYRFPDSAYNTVTVDPASGHVITARGSSVREFDASGASEPTLIGTFAGVGASVEGVAVNDAAEGVYVSRPESTLNQVEVYGPLVPIPEALTGDVTSIGTTSATLNGAVKPDGAEVTECRFEYGKTTAYGQSVSCAQSPAAIGAGASFVPVHADLSGLELGAKYHFRLIVRNANGKDPEFPSKSDGGDGTFKLNSPPTIAAWAEKVGLDDATLGAQINPWGFETTYHFEWGATASYGNSSAELAVGSDQSDHVVNRLLEGLQPGASYHFKVVATNEIGTAESEDRTFATFPLPTAPDPCPNDAFRTGPSAALPDCRAYEMVSPLEKNGGDIQIVNGALGGQYPSFKQSSLDGERLTYTTGTAFGDAVAGPFANQYLSSRDSDGWSTHGISPPFGATLFEGKGDIPPLGWTLETLFDGFTPDLCSAWVRGAGVTPLTPAGLSGHVNLYRRSNCGEEGYEALTNEGPFGPASPSLNSRDETLSEGLLGTGPGVRLQGYSADLSHQVFVAGAALTPDSPGYEAKCSTPSAATSTAYQWLRNGAPIAGATSPTYTIAPADEGTAVQCQVFALNANAGSTQVANPPRVVAPLSATPLPKAPASIDAPTASAPLTLGGGGQTLTCDPEAESWGGAPLFTYGWYRNGSPIAGASASTYLISAADLATRAVFQCAVFATNAAGTVVKVSNHRPTIPAPSPAAPGGNAPTASAKASTWELKTRLYDLHDGQLELAGILPNGEPNPENSAAGTLGDGVRLRESTLEHAVSEDGSRIFWTSTNSDINAAGPGQIYARVDGAETVPVSAAAEALSGSSESLFWTAAADGSAALFSTGNFGPENLSSDADLYEFDVDSETTRLIAEHSPGVLGASEDLSRIYFVSTDELAEGAVAGKWNLYLEEDGAKRLVAILSADDEELHVVGISPIRPFPVRRTSRVSADGRQIAFEALASLTGYDNVDPASGKRFTEVFHYDAEAGKLSCVSCNPSGARPSGIPIPSPYDSAEDELKHELSFNSRFGEAAALPTWEREQHAAQVLSEDGNRVFFHSREALVIGDVNGIRDVYEWEAPGTGSCEAASAEYVAQNGGCVYLISTGKSKQLSEFLDASADGGDVFISTTSGIDPRDEGLIDIYDARVGGGFPGPAPKPECAGDSCQSVPAAPEDPTPASALAEGAGNVRPASSCASQGRRAARLERQAKRAKGPRAVRLAKQIERLRAQAKRCRHSRKGSK